MEPTEALENDNDLTIVGAATVAAAVVLLGLGALKMGRIVKSKLDARKAQSTDETN